MVGMELRSKVSEYVKERIGELGGSVAGVLLLLLPLLPCVGLLRACAPSGSGV